MNLVLLNLVLEKALESPLDCKEIQPVHPKRDQSWIFTGRTDAKAETPILWPPDAKSWLIWKDTEELTHWKRPLCWERLRARGEGDNRGWGGWMASSTWWTWVWASFRSWTCISCWSEWLLSKSLQTINAREGVEKREPTYIVGGNAN